MLADSWARDARYADPILRGGGIEEIDALVAGAQGRFPGFSFALRGAPSGHGEFVRFSWRLGPLQGEAPIVGSDLLVMKGERIEQVIGFLDKVPQAA